MKRFIQGEHRGQGTLLPESLDDYVSDTNPVRVVDVFVDELNLVSLGFDGAIPADTGRPAYHPAILLKIYIYGYLNRIQSSRRLEREAQRNVELMWLTGRLMPDFKTIANFRKDNSKAIRGVCRQFVVLCQQLGLFGENLVAIDGSKFKAVNNRDRNFTSAKLKRRMEETESSINRYLTALDAADRQEPTASEPSAVRLEEKIAKLKTQMKELKAIEIQLNESPDKQVSLTDPDARSMMTRGTGIVGYNVQTAVDTQNHLIVAHEVTNFGSDRDQLSSMAKQARDAMASETLAVVADRGYFKSEEILACHDADITAYVPKPMTSSAKADGRFNKDAFVYDATKNEYICPAGEALIWHYSYVEKGLKMHRYWSSKCRGCALKSQCTPSTERRVRRWEYEDVLEEMQLRLSKAPEMMRVRKRTVEHSFGTLKQWMGATHFLTRKLAGVSAEMSLNVLAYNMKRVMKIMGANGLMKALSA
ncbi:MULTISPECIES: IS1182 family transposase [Pseudomonas]|jgi:transposase|uniref:IS1182 family transposase n=2 Tax=Pseudomonas TaxID=286 RepID=A0A7X1GAE8_9PSED|nr:MULTISPECIES: IS1182 family transposase [Pseudomonas]MBC2688846.1 IS1182 family transposase [Pseudomonas kielensis]NBB35130.1 IS1182 family transposase [Pseudomonas sp. BC115LW]UZM15112.1 IS1182 family transposase [Pseudomonas kielensis]WKL52745.1 IS1182 family transposase [Pseudomonas kielensis]